MTFTTTTEQDTAITVLANTAGCDLRTYIQRMIDRAFTDGQSVQLALDRDTIYAKYMASDLITKAAVDAIKLGK